jgi:hypothetical protein
VIEYAVGWERFVETIEEAEELALPADFDYLEHLEGQYRRLRGYAPALLETFEFSAAPPAEPLLEAVGVLREMNVAGKRKVPDDAPTSFVRPRWERHVFGGDEGIARRYYEMSAMTELKSGLKSGDVWVPGSRRYANFEDCLLPRPAWESMKGDRSYEDQMNRAGGLALLTAAIALWNAAHLPAAVEELRGRGENVPEGMLPHLSPLGWEHITLTGTYRWDLAAPSTLTAVLGDLRR